MLAMEFCTVLVCEPAELLLKAICSADMGPAYRNVIGIPGGVHSPLFKILQAWLSFVDIKAYSPA